jgi:[protein-PII] uridylyltransferase
VADRRSSGHVGDRAKQDLSDPDVITAFAAKMGTERRLTALYLLTVADIRGTSPRVWNNWKGKLLEDLFHATRAVLAGTSPTQTIMDSVEARRMEARRLLRLYAVPENAEANLWRNLDTPYFQRHTAEEIAWHARHLYWRAGRTAPWSRRGSRDGAGLQVFVYLQDQGAVCAAMRILRPRGALDHRGQDPHDARGLRARYVRVERPSQTAARRTAKYCRWWVRAPRC